MQELSRLKLKDKKYIIFDMDGTLIDSIGVYNETDQKLIKKFSNQLVDLDSIQTERDSFLHAHQNSDSYLAYCDYLAKKYHFENQDAKSIMRLRWEISSAILENEVTYRPNVTELIMQLHSLGFILILATMTTQIQLDIYSKKNKAMLKQMDITKTFDLIKKMEDVKNKKPDPEIYTQVMQYYNTSPNECLVFEDSYTGVLASKNAGIEVVNIYDKYADVDRDRINEIADYSIRDFSEFIEYINSIY